MVLELAAVLLYVVPLFTQVVREEPSLLFVPCIAGWGVGLSHFDNMACGGIHTTFVKFPASALAV